MVKQQVCSPFSQVAGEMVLGRNKVTWSNGRLPANEIVVFTSRRALNYEMLLAE